MQDTQELTREQRNKQYYKPYTEAKYALDLKECKKTFNYADRTEDEFNEIQKASNSLLINAINDFFASPILLLLRLTTKINQYSSKKIYEAGLRDTDDFELFYTLDKRLRQIDSFTKRKFNFEIFRTSTRPDYLTNLKQKTEEMNNTELSYEDQLGI